MLVDKPYYNEPGHEKQAGSAEGEQHAQRYNENTRLLALQVGRALCSPFFSRPSSGCEHCDLRGPPV